MLDVGRATEFFVIPQVSVLRAVSSREHHVTRSDAAVNIKFALRAITSLSDRATKRSVTFLRGAVALVTRMIDLRNKIFFIKYSGVVGVINTKNNTYCLRDNYRGIEEMPFYLLIVFSNDIMFNCRCRLVNTRVYHLGSTTEMLTLGTRREFLSRTTVLAFFLTNDAITVTLRKRVIVPPAFSLSLFFILCIDTQNNN